MEHYYRDVPGWAAFADLYVEVVSKARSPSLFVEVGSWLGRSAALMGIEIANSGKDIKMICVDPWVDGGPDLRDTPHFKKLTAPIYDQFLANTDRVRPFITPLRLMSVDAAKQFQDRSVDFLMLDGDHSYEAVKADLKAWLPKMRPDGIISGDDYGWPGVTRAVNEAFSPSKVKVVWKKHHANYLNSASYWSVQL